MTPMYMANYLCELHQSTIYVSPSACSLQEMIKKCAAADVIFNAKISNLSRVGPSCDNQYCRFGPWITQSMKWDKEMKYLGIILYLL